MECAPYLWEMSMESIQYSQEYRYGIQLVFLHKGLNTMQNQGFNIEVLNVADHVDLNHMPVQT